MYLKFMWDQHETATCNFGRAGGTSMHESHAQCMRLEKSGCTALVCGVYVCVCMCVCVYVCLCLCV